jgi:hypothetical protein
MTVEIAIMNREAVALAADSAVTLTGGEGQRMFPSGHKLFDISADHSVGIMIYNKGSFMGIPWEGIVGMYRASVGAAKFKTLSGYADKMMGILKSLAIRIPRSEQEMYLRRAAFYLFDRICDDIAENIKDQEKKTNDTVDRARCRRIILNTINSFLRRIESLPDISGPTGFAGVIDRKYGSLISEVAQEVFQNKEIPLSKSSIAEQKLRQVGSRFFTKDTESFFIDPEYSGLVITGLGEQDLFPSVLTFRVRGALQRVLIYQQIEDLCCSVDFDRPAAFIPFAQSDVIDTFRYGIRPDYTERIKKRLDGLSRQSWVKHAPSVLRLLGGMRQGANTRDKLMKKTALIVIDTVLDFKDSLKDDRRLLDERLEGFISVLPRSELAEMARTLVEFTCFYRKYTEFEGEEITVAEPVHAAVISKNEGFVWVE